MPICPKKHWNAIFDLFRIFDTNVRYEKKKKRQIVMFTKQKYPFDEKNLLFDTLFIFESHFFDISAF